MYNNFNPKMSVNTSDQYFLNIKQNQIKMVKARGYDVSEEEWILKENLSAKEFRKKLLKKYENNNYPYDYSIRKLMYSEYQKTNSKPLFVYYVGLQGGKQIKIDSVRPFISKMTEEDKNGILVIDSILSPEASKCLNYVTESKYQIFKEEELNFDLLSVNTVSEYFIIDSQKLKNSLAVSSKTMTIMHSTDPVAKYYHFLSGQTVYTKVENDVDTINDYTYENYIVV